jgi:hypothetical protein
MNKPKRKSKPKHKVSSLVTQLLFKYGRYMTMTEKLKLRATNQTTMSINGVHWELQIENNKPRMRIVERETFMEDDYA